MQSKQVCQDYSKIVHWNDLCTSLYLPLATLFLYHSNYVLLLGNAISIYNILILAFLEVLKFVIFARSQKTVHRTIKDLTKSVLAVILFVCAMYVVTVLFGASVFSKIEETFMFTLLVATFTALPICLHFGAETAVTMFLSITSFDGSEIQNLFMLKLRLTLFGAWLGAIAIPLDWNRPWQTWPIPCCVGTILGYTVANWVSSFLQYSRRHKLSKKTGKYTL
ncbi:phosphatidylinositol-glycan biosynthesis class F protein [Zophobas morio]|uniref:phosphatidylinositol-glycan biosynthesis class F protein n=1 Tax=Zophobas morio TaxID=2755281 RepID=UPI003083BFC1